MKKAPFLALVAVIVLLIGMWPPWPAGSQTPVIGPIAQTFTSSASPPIRACGLKGQNAASFQSTGAGPIDASVSNDGFSWTPTVITSMAGAVQAQPFTPTSGTTYQVAPLTADCVEIAPDSTWSGQTVTVTFKASGAAASNAGSSSSGTIACATPGCVIASMPPPVQPSPLYTQPVTTPAPAPTNASDSGINVHISGPTPSPLPTISPNVQQVAYVGPPTTTAINGNNVATVDSSGNSYALVCAKATQTCAAVSTFGGLTGPILQAGVIGKNQALLSATSGTCTNVVAQTTVLQLVDYASASAQTGTLAVYNEAAATCAAGDLVYTRATAAASLLDLLGPGIYMSAGITYKWTTAAEVGNVLVQYY